MYQFSVPFIPTSLALSIHVICVSKIIFNPCMYIYTVHENNRFRVACTAKGINYFVN